MSARFWPVYQMRHLNKNLALAEKRQQKVISRMEACGYITEEETTLMAAQLVAFY